jgi:hypothetical protein
MTVKSAWAHVETYKNHKITIIEDISHLTGGMSITNDAENVLQNFHDDFGNDWRVVYKDTSGEWWEIVPKRAKTGWPFIESVVFEPWNGLAWDLLQR